MSLDRTLRLKGALSGSRSVLTRAERIARLVTEGKFDPESDNPLGLPKVKVRHSRAGTKSKKEAPTEETAEDAIEGEAEGAEEAKE
ncbi:MAG: small basic protein [Phycisphaerae bacterium]|jgi:small basic protein (TIGR04137 family)|nr:small basic protein [Phycisphaerae bacterium]